MALPPKIQTYHCICSTLLLASTHVLSSLPRRSTSSPNTLSAAIILPLPDSPPTFSSTSDADHDMREEEEQDMPEEGYTMLLGMQQDKKVVIVRREDGFEKRLCWRCERCGVVVGYELVTSGGEDSVKGKEGEGGYRGKVMYILPGGMQSTEVMRGGRKIGEVDVGRDGGVAVFE